MEARSSRSSDYQQVGGANNPGGVKVASLPSRLVVTVNTQSHRGHSSWDGERSFTVDEPLPTAFDVDQMGEVGRAQLQALHQKMKASLGQVEPQVLEP